MGTENSWTLSSVKLLLANYYQAVVPGTGAPSGTVTIGIYNVAGQTPTGDPLGTGSISQVGLAEVTTWADMINGVGGSYYTIDITPEVTLVADTAYFMVVNATDGDYLGTTIIYQSLFGFGDLGYTAIPGRLWYTNSGTWTIGSPHGGARMIYQLDGTEITGEEPGEGVTDLIAFPPSRPDGYDPDLIWTPGEWTDPSTYVDPGWGTTYVATGGGRWGQNLVAAGNNLIYYEAF
ncbi:MAG: hypothetical protein ACYS4W_14325 [Planctomycetota bacterium]